MLGGRDVHPSGTLATAARCQNPAPMTLRERIRQEVVETRERPERVRNLFSGEHLRDFVATLRGRRQVGLPAPPWSDSDGEVVTRLYASYDDYVKHQAAKLETLDLTNYDREYRHLLRERLRSAGQVQADMSVVCLGARIGTEVKAFHDLGCFAVGIDLNPGPDNRYVLHGDFHDLQFPDGSAQVAFTNALDHALDIDRLLGEVHRVLRPSGLFVAEIERGSDEGAEPREYESFFWRTADQLAAMIEARGFDQVHDLPFEQPWRGRHVTFRRRGAAS
jgi:SAM-dependent methyltransferase